jgi:hypothetical protein
MRWYRSPCRLLQTITCSEVVFFTQNGGSWLTEPRDLVFRTYVECADPNACVSSPDPPFSGTPRTCPPRHKLVRSHHARSQKKPIPRGKQWQASMTEGCQSAGGKYPSNSGMLRVDWTIRSRLQPADVARTPHTRLIPTAAWPDTKASPVMRT